MSRIFEGVEALTFDCYGTIVDWETGILAAARELLGDVEVGDEEVLEWFGRHESEAERPPFRRYRDVLADVAQRMARSAGRSVSDDEAARFAASVPLWPPFADSRAALQRLSSQYRLAIVSNVDDDLFEGTARRLDIDFDPVVTAEQVGCYKPEPDHFHEVLRRLDLPLDRVVHVAQSLYHDVAPATALGFRCVWVDRRQGRPGSGATPPAEATPDLVVPDLAALAREAGV